MIITQHELDHIRSNYQRGFAEGRRKGLAEAVKIVMSDAVSVNATPEVGEVFDVEKYNYANKLLNEHTLFIKKAIEAAAEAGA